VRVTRRSAGLLSRTKRVARIECTLGETRASIAWDGAALDARRSRVVRGIALSNEQLELHAWLDALARDLAEEAARSEQARLALERLLQA
jgi:hypothetical protein